MSDPAVRKFFGADQVVYTPRDPARQLEALGGGWYRLPNGEKVQGKQRALDKLGGDAPPT